MAEVLNMDLLSRPGKAVVRKGAVFVAEMPKGYTNFTYYDGTLIITGADQPPLVFEEETGRWLVLCCDGEFSYADQP